MGISAAECRLGILGGSFDPVHRGHLHVANAALAELNLSELRILPCYIAPHKGQFHVSNADRLAMLERCFQGRNNIHIDCREWRRQQVSYSYDTLVELRGEIGRTASIIFIVGWDSWRQLMQWYRWRELFDLCNFAVARRSDANAVLEGEFTEFLRARELSPNQLTEVCCGHFAHLKAPELNISSTFVRAKLASEDPSAEALLPQGVWSLVQSRGLYTK